MLVPTGWILYSLPVALGALSPGSIPGIVVLLKLTACLANGVCTPRTCALPPRRFALVLIYFLAPKKYLAPKRQDSMGGDSEAALGSPECGDLEAGKDSAPPSDAGEVPEIKAHRP